MTIIGILLPSSRPAPQSAAGYAERWRTDGPRQNRASRRRSFASRIGRSPAARRRPDAQWRIGAASRRPSGRARGRLARCGFAPAPRRAALRAALEASPDAAGTSLPLWPRAVALVERGTPSDMLPKLNYLGISRGFEFSRPCVRCPRPAPEAIAICRSRWRGRTVGRCPVRRSCNGLDAVRILCRATVEHVAPRVRAVTRRGGVRGFVPPQRDARARAGRPATTRRQHGFPSGRIALGAARALQHRSSTGSRGWPIRRFRRWCLDHAWGR